MVAFRTVPLPDRFQCKYLFSSNYAANQGHPATHAAAEKERAAAAFVFRGKHPVGEVILNIPKRRCKVAEISQEMLLALLKSLDGTHCLKCDGFPADASAAGVWTDSMNGRVCLLVESASFPEVDPGDEWPVLSPVLTVVKPSWREQTPLL